MSQKTRETRRTFLKLTGVAAAGATLVNPVEAAANGWQVVESGVGVTLYDAAMTSEGPYAVGAGGLVLSRRKDGWQPVLERGPTVESNPLRGCDVTDDGRNVWFCGGSGVVGQYDVVDEQLTDYSAPMGKTSTWLNVAVRGDAGSETVYLVNGSGEFLAGTKTSAGGMDWGDVVKPGGGSSAPGIDFWTDDAGYVSDTTGKVYRTEDGGRTWTTVGINGASVNLNDVAVRNEGDIDVAGGNGTIYRLNDGDGKGWKRKNVGEETVLAVYRTGAEGGLGCGTGGYVYDRKKNKWDRVETPTTNTLRGVATGDSGQYPQVAVGDSGTIVERGEYTADLPNTVSLSADSSLEYRLDVDGAVEQAGDVESSDTVTNRTSRFSVDTVTGTLTSGDTDTYDYSGEIVDLEVTSGDPAALTVTVNGSESSLSQLASEPWTEAASPTGQTLNGVVQTVEGPYAVGNGGEVLARRADGWEFVLESGPTTASNPLTGAAVSDDGRNVWFCGGSGVVGQYDVVDEQVTDYSAPGGKTSTWEDLAVTGAAGSETVHLVNGSGEYLKGTKTSAGGMNWGTAFKPGGGSSMKAVTFVDSTTGYAVDTNAKVYETTNGGDSFTVVGIDGGSVGLYGVDATATDDVVAAGGDGSLFRYNGAVWTKLYAGGNQLGDVSLDGPDGLTCGAGGTVWELSLDGWEPVETPVTATLAGVSLGTTGTYPDVAVGSSGTILERGDYTATPSDILTISSTDGSDVSYRVEVDGVVQKADRADGDDSVSGSTVEGSVGGVNLEDSYRFSGTITDFVVTSGDAAALAIEVNDESQSVGQLSAAGWTEVTSPTGNGLNGAAIGADGPYAVSGGGEVLARRDSGWTVVTTFPGGGNTFALTCADASSDGGNVWFAGASGAVGRYDTSTGTISDYSAPKGKTSTWESVAVAGPAGAETLYLANGSGEVLKGTNSAGVVTWSDVQKPGGGSSIKGGTALDASTAYFVDTNAKVYETTDGGESWSTVGIPGGTVGLYGVGAGSTEDISVAGGDGSILRYNGAVWTRLDVADGGFTALVRDRENALAVGGSGRVYRRTWDGWEREETPAAVTLGGVALGGEFPDVTVGSSGTIFERRL
ncbi:twin-arginine translocation signal domain-containing protein [Halomarina oriensis]|uniref:Twin-arginine translocation signal domain-containing protein n=1 Tax=Halomarina oriensis TaxID=671145 RepID=A0A6B0GHS4_9EURY|nr:twin-arginine translocation signal domain-containing protein [Halomarina oriensis]MWG34412.1 twin-arginine translocation signal domain-containing protein [Halomarina oriensis]